VSRPPDQFFLNSKVAADDPRDGVFGLTGHGRVTDSLESRCERRDQKWCEDAEHRHTARPIWRHPRYRAVGYVRSGAVNLGGGLTHAANVLDDRSALPTYHSTR
jgi:hypothetical protein